MCSRKFNLYGCRLHTLSSEEDAFDAEAIQLMIARKSNSTNQIPNTGNILKKE